VSHFFSREAVGGGCDIGEHENLLRKMHPMSQPSVCPQGGGYDIKGLL
jgi:hypothetical protein